MLLITNYKANMFLKTNNLTNSKVPGQVPPRIWQQQNSGSKGLLGKQPVGSEGARHTTIASSERLDTIRKKHVFVPPGRHGEVSVSYDERAFSWTRWTSASNDNKAAE